MTTTTTSNNETSSIVKMPKLLELYYFDITGKGEPIRQLCAYAGLDLVDHRLTSYEAFVAMKESGKLAFGQVPMLQVTMSNDGNDTVVHQLVQSSAILRYLSKLGAIAGDSGNRKMDCLDADPLLAARVDAALDQEVDAFTGSTVTAYANRFGLHDCPETIMEAWKEAIGTEILPRHLQHIERLLQQSSTGWLAGTTFPSAADFVWYNRLVETVQSRVPQELWTNQDTFPAVHAFLAKFEALEAMQTYQEANKKK